MNRFYITTAIPYVNADPHQGFAMELVQGDVLARYHRLIGDDTFFLCGSDENALKNVQAAEKAGVSIQEFIDQHATKFIDLTKALNLSNDDFIRTTEDRHIRSSQKLWLLCDKAGDIYKKKYKGLYCVGCEEFKTKKELVDGLCSEHKVAPEEVEEENYFFRLSKYQKPLEDLIDSGRLEIIPETKKNEVREFIHQGLEDFSISRSKERAKNWGIDVPGDPDSKIYVWFDALINYLSALGFADDDLKFEKYWQENQERCHLIGKGISRFHCIFFPAMLLSAGLKPPSRVYIHGYLTIGGEKISKSLGNVVDPFVIIEKYTSDVVRYFLLREIPSDGDGDFSEEKLKERYQGDLANGLGNLVQRVVTLIEKGLDSELVYSPDTIQKEVIKKSASIEAIWHEKIKNFKLHEALAAVWDLIGFANAYVDQHKPWKTIEENPKHFLETITNLVFLLLSINKMISPFLPETSDKIYKILGVKPETDPLNGYTFLVKKGEPLFPRLSE